MAQIQLVCALWAFCLVTASLSLQTYGPCASIWIVSRLGTNACLPPNTDCLCYASAGYLEGVSIDIQSNCEAANALQDAANVLAANCAELDQTPALNTAQFLAVGYYPASDTLAIPPTTFYDYSTVPNAKATGSSLTSVEYVSTNFPGVTTEPGLGPVATGTTSIGPVPFTPTTTSAMPSTTAMVTTSAVPSTTATASTKPKGSSGNTLFGRAEVFASLFASVWSIYLGLHVF